MNATPRTAANTQADRALSVASPDIQGSAEQNAVPVRVLNAVRAENLVRGPDQQSCSPSRPTADLPGGTQAYVLAVAEHATRQAVSMRGGHAAPQLSAFGLA